MTPVEVLAALASIVVIDIVLGGDNAILIALASKNLHPEQRKKAMFWGVVGAITVRGLLACVALYVLQIPLLQLIGGILLVWIAVKLLVEKKDVTCEAGNNLLDAIKIIIIADVVMGIDNVIAIAGASHGSPILVILGLLISVPIIVGGSTIILKWMDKYPWIIYIGGGVLAWTAGKMMVSDGYIAPIAAQYVPYYNLLIPAVVLVLVLLFGYCKNKYAPATCEIPSENSRL